MSASAILIFFTVSLLFSPFMDVYSNTKSLEFPFEAKGRELHQKKQNKQN